MKTNNHQTRHTRSRLPKYAVPVFIRVVKNMIPFHNNKQNKVPLREEGVDPDKTCPEDTFLWIDELGKGRAYVDFSRSDWEDLRSGKATV